MTCSESQLIGEIHNILYKIQTSLTPLSYDHCLYWCEETDLETLLVQLSQHLPSHVGNFHSINGVLFLNSSHAVIVYALFFDYHSFASHL